MTDVPATTRLSSEVPRRTYSEDEVVTIYELGRWYLETGDFRAAEVVAAGLAEVAPDFLPALLLLSVLGLLNNSPDRAALAATKAVAVDPKSVNAQILLATSHLSLGDLHAAGTLLGEIGDRIEGHEIDDPMIGRFHALQVGRYKTLVGKS